MATLLRYARGGHVWNVVAAALNQGSTFVANLLLANLLLPEDFGRYGAIQISVTAIAAAAQLSVWLSTAHFCGRYRDSQPEKLGRVLYVIRAVVFVVTGCATLLLLFVRDQYAAVFLHDANAGLEVGAAAFYVLFSGLNSYQTGVLVGLDALKTYARLASLTGLVAVALIVSLGHFGGVLWALCGLSLSSAIRWAMTARLVSAALATARIRLQRGGASPEWAEIATFSLPASINSLTYMASLWLAAATVVSQPDGLFLSALYVAGMNIKTLVLFVPQQANAASISYLSRYRANASGEYRSALLWNLSMISVATLSAAAIVALLAPYVLGLYGDRFLLGVPLLQLLMLAAVAEAIGYGLTQYFSSRGQMWTVLFAASLPRDLIVVVGVLVFLPAYGLTSVALTFLASWLLYSAGLSIAIMRRSGRRSGSEH